MSEANELEPKTASPTAPAEPPIGVPGAVPRDALKPSSVELGGGGGGPLPPSSGFGGGDDGGDDEEEEMTKMSFLDHLEELRRRLINSLIAIAGGFGVCFWFSQWIFEQLSKPIVAAQIKLKLPTKMVFFHPAD